eukprot:Seg1318.6 transcript_id=Seg1318.6/GoldUCD/mRNA.D3Y31 product="hypothetical protein" protein_id=Seg1318.6/GoldUCD/D3Y31
MGNADSVGDCEHRGGFGKCRGSAGCGERQRCRIRGDGKVQRGLKGVDNVTILEFKEMIELVEDRVEVESVESVEDVGMVEGVVQGRDDAGMVESKGGVKNVRM